MHGRCCFQPPGTIIGWPWHHVDRASACHAVAAATSSFNRRVRHGKIGTNSRRGVSELRQQEKTMDCHSNTNGQFQPKLLTLRLQQADCVQDLEVLWEAHNQQFNSIHFSTLMHQLALLHDMPTAHLAQKQQEQEQQEQEQQQQDFGSPPGASVPWEPASRQRQQQQQQQQQRTQQEMCDAVSLSSEAGFQAGLDIDSGNLQELLQSNHCDTPQQQQQQQQSRSQGRQQQQQQSRPRLPPIRRHQQRLQADKATDAHVAPQGAAAASEQDRLAQLACAAVTAAMQPAAVEQLDARALVMMLLNLAKIQVHRPQLVMRLLQAVQPRLQQLDPQQVSNLIWAVAAHATAPPQAMAGSSSSSSSSSSSGGGSGTYTRWSGSSSRLLVSQDWLQEACGVLLLRLADADSCGVTMALWGLAQLGYRPPQAWWDSLFQETQQRLAAFKGSELPVLIYCCGKLKPQVPEEWLSQYLAASCDHLQTMSNQHLTMSVWGLAAAGLLPHKAWLMAWFLNSRAAMPTASSQDLSLWLYSLVLLKLTPSPVWCHSFVEAAFDKLTAPGTRPQELVNVMWAVSRMAWSPPLLFWQGLMQAACERFNSFNPQDLANCISAAVAVDIHSINRDWLRAFIKVSGPKLSTFLPVQLANTGCALASVTKAHPWAHTMVPVTWLAAYVQAATGLLGQSKFSARNLEMVIANIKQLDYRPTAVETQDFLQRAESVLQHQHKRATCSN